MLSPPKDAANSPSKQEEAQAGAGTDTGAAPAAPPKKKKFQNGWTREVEQLMAEWADKALGYRWMHERTERIFYSKDLSFMFPVIILSTVTGAANFALDSVIQDPEYKKYAQLGLGGLSILTGIISTIANRLGYGSRSEAHKSAGVLWGKFQRLIAIELSLHPDERSDCMYFLKTCRTELDRLIEQSPTIPDAVISECRREFTKYPKVRKPEIVGDIDTTHVFVDTESRLKKIAQEAAITLAQKKGVLKQIVLDDLEPRIQRVIDHSTLPAIRENLRGEVRTAAAAAAREAVLSGARSSAQVVPSANAAAAVGTAAIRAEREEEVNRVAMSGVVRAMREKLEIANEKTGRVPAGIGSVLVEIPTAATILAVPALTATADTIQHVGADLEAGEMGFDEESTDEEAAAAPAPAPTPATAEATPEAATQETAPEANAPEATPDANSEAPLDLVDASGDTL